VLISRVAAITRPDLDRGLGVAGHADDAIWKFVVFVLASVADLFLEVLLAPSEELGKLRKIGGVGPEGLTTPDHVRVDKEVFDAILSEKFLNSLSGPRGLVLPHGGLPIVARTVGALRQPDSPGFAAKVAFVGLNSEFDLGRTAFVGT